jgi:xanthine dehydrogenase YagS FAD-binding subunit
MNRFEWADATSVQDAVALASARRDSAYKAGGVDLVDLMKEHIAAPPRVVNIRNIRGLDYATEDQAGLKLGPLITLAKIEEHPLLREKYTALAIAAARAATPQIRNMATLGGNLLQRPRCWYFRSEAFHCRRKGGGECFAQEGENQYHAIYDNKNCAIVHPSGTAVPLIAFGATLELAGPDGKRQARLEDFFYTPEEDIQHEAKIQPGELVTEIRIPKPADGARSWYIKQGEKESFDWPIADVAVVLERDGQTCKRASIVLGAFAPTPHRAKEAEAALAGKQIDEKIARDAAKSALAKATPMSQNGYKLAVFETVITRAILSAAQQHEQQQ